MLLLADGRGGERHLLDGALVHAAQNAEKALLAWVE